MPLKRHVIGSSTCARRRHLKAVFAFTPRQHHHMFAAYAPQFAEILLKRLYTYYLPALRYVERSMLTSPLTILHYASFAEGAMPAYAPLYFAYARAATDKLLSADILPLRSMPAAMRWSPTRDY